MTPTKGRRWVNALLIVAACLASAVLAVIFVPKVTTLASNAIVVPKHTKIPSGVPYEVIVETIAPAIEKLSQENRDLLDKWLKRRTVTMSQVAKARNQQTSDLTFTQVGSQIGGSVGGFGGAIMGLLGAAAGAEADLKRAKRHEEWSASIEKWLANGVPVGTTIGMAIDDQMKYEEDVRQKELKKQAAIEEMRQAVAVNLISKKTFVKANGREYIEFGEYCISNDFELCCQL